MLAGASIALAVAALVARAAEPPEARRGVQLTFTGYASGAVGTLGNGVGLQDGARTALEGEAALLWKFGPAWGAGIYVGFGGSQSGPDVGAACAHASPDCHASGVARLGLLVRRDLRPAARWNPWLSAGAGLEALSFHGTWVYEPETTIWHGVELLRLGAGVDYRAWKSLGLGLQLLGSVGEYTDVEVHWGQGLEGPLDVYGRKPETRGLHGWIGVGLRAVVLP